MPNAKNVIPHQFKKGQTGNPTGRPKKLPELDTLLLDVLSNEDKGGITAAQRILHALVKKAEQGDIRAAELIFDRAYGKALQSIQQNNVVRIVDESSDSSFTPPRAADFTCV